MYCTERILFLTCKFGKVITLCLSCLYVQRKNVIMTHMYYRAFFSQLSSVVSASTVSTKDVTSSSSLRSSDRALTVATTGVASPVGTTEGPSGSLVSSALLLVRSREDEDAGLGGFRGFCPGSNGLRSARSGDKLPSTLPRARAMVLRNAGFGLLLPEGVSWDVDGGGGVCRPPGKGELDRE